MLPQHGPRGLQEGPYGVAVPAALPAGTVGVLATASARDRETTMAGFSRDKKDQGVANEGVNRGSDAV